MTTTTASPFSMTVVESGSPAAPVQATQACVHLDVAGVENR